MMALGAEAVFVGSGIFKSADPAKRARPIVRATTHWQDAEGRGRGLARARRSHARASRFAQIPEGERLADARLVMAGDVRRPGPAGRLRRPRGGLSGRGRRGARGAPRGRARRPRRPRAPGRREHDAPQPDARRAVVRGARAPCTRAAASSRAPAPARSCSRARCRPRQPSLGLLDAVVERNAFGRQVDSFEATVEAEALGGVTAALTVTAWIASEVPLAFLTVNLTV